jgi:hypothetical protein
VKAAAGAIHALVTSISDGIAKPVIHQGIVPENLSVGKFPTGSRSQPPININRIAGRTETRKNIKTDKMKNMR